MCTIIHCKFLIKIINYMHHDQMVTKLIEPHSSYRQNIMQFGWIWAGLTVQFNRGKKNAYNLDFNFFNIPWLR